MTTNITQAQQRSSKYAVQATLVTELAVVSVLFTFLLSATDSTNFLGQFFAWISLPTFAVFVLSTVVFSYVLGQKVGSGRLAKENISYFTCCLTALSVVWLSTLLTSLIALGSQRFAGELPPTWMIHYLAKPMVWMTFLSLVPVFIASVWYRHQLVRSLSSEAE